MDSATVSFLQILRNRVEELVADGNMDEAIHAATAAMDKAQQRLSGDPESVNVFGDAVEVRADVYRKVGRLENALDDYRHAIMVLEECEDHQVQLGRLYAGLGATYDAMGRPDDALASWEKALEFFENSDPPAPLDVAAMCNNLAFLHRSAEDLEEAETYLLKALEISHRELGPQHEETALLCNNLGACYQAGGHHEQAREMHMMALDARQELFGSSHPDTAQSHNNLALTLAMSGDREAAVAHFNMALDGFTAAGADYSEDLAAVAENYAAYLRQQGDERAAVRIGGAGRGRPLRLKVDFLGGGVRRNPSPVKAPHHGAGWLVGEPFWRTDRLQRPWWGAFFCPDDGGLGKTAVGNRGQRW